MSAVDEMVDYDQLDLDRNDHLDSDGIDDFHIGGQLLHFAASLWELLNFAVYIKNPLIDPVSVCW